MGRALTHVGLVAIALVTQLVFDTLPLPGGTAPNLVLLVVAAIALTSGPMPGVVMGFVAGLALDLTPPANHAIGEYALVFCLVGYFCGLAAGEINRPAAMPLAAMALGALGGSALYTVVSVIFGEADVTWAAAWHVLPLSVTYEVLLSPFVLYIVIRLTRLAGLAAEEPGAALARAAWLPASLGGKAAATRQPKQPKLRPGAARSGLISVTTPAGPAAAGGPALAGFGGGPGGRTGAGRPASLGRRSGLGGRSGLGRRAGLGAWVGLGARKGSGRTALGGSVSGGGTGPGRRTAPGGRSAFSGGRTALGRTGGVSGRQRPRLRFGSSRSPDLNVSGLPSIFGGGSLVSQPRARLRLRAGRPGRPRQAHRAATGAVREPARLRLGVRRQSTLVRLGRMAGLASPHRPRAAAPRFGRARSGRARSGRARSGRAGPEFRA